MFQKIKKYEVIVEAKDHGTPSLSSTAVVTLNIVDTNTHPPMFKDRKAWTFKLLILLSLKLLFRVMYDVKDETVLPVQYHGEVLESVIIDNVLRVAVEDKDTPQTPGWRAIYYFIKGNEDGNYKLETDPNTNEGILNIIKVILLFRRK